jgi:hypothetical protein
MAGQVNRRTFCPAGISTRIYAGTAFSGALWYSASGGSQTISFNLYSSSPPFNWNDNKDVGPAFLTFPGAILIEVWANPTSQSCFINCTGF